MTTTEKNKRIEEVEKKMEELRKELSEIRETPTTDYSFEKWYKSVKGRGLNTICYQAPNLEISKVISTSFDLYCSQLMFSYCYDNNWFMKTCKLGYYIVYNESAKRYEVPTNTPYFRNPLVVYFSSMGNAEKCADWLNNGGEVEDEL